MWEQSTILKIFKDVIGCTQKATKWILETHECGSKICEEEGLRWSEIGWGRRLGKEGGYMGNEKREESEWKICCSEKKMYTIHHLSYLCILD